MGFDWVKAQEVDTRIPEAVNVSEIKVCLLGGGFALKNWTWKTSFWLSRMEQESWEGAHGNSFPDVSETPVLFQTLSGHLEYVGEQNYKAPFPGGIHLSFLAQNKSALKKKSNLFWDHPSSGPECCSIHLWETLLPLVWYSVVSRQMPWVALAFLFKLNFQSKFQWSVSQRAGRSVT